LKEKTIKYCFSKDLVLRTPTLSICSYTITAKNLYATFLNDQNNEALFLSSSILNNELSNLGNVKPPLPRVRQLTDRVKP